ncbi:MAG: tagaturonate reductase [Firmicutes bacterium]|nr:tagaturonate reductase [Bacillota bacterium]
MERLTYKTLKDQGYDGYLLPEAPERVLQFGDGNFLRAFADHFIDEMNEKAGFDAKVVVVQPNAPTLNPKLNEQEGLYTLFLRGRDQGEQVNHKRVISCISRVINAREQWSQVLACAANPSLRFLISNTTEAGIVYDDGCRREDAPPKSFPAKLTAFLYERFCLGLPGFVILPCELIDNNGRALADCIDRYIDLWALGEDFRTWVKKENIICDTLVDRIVTGYPKTEAAALCTELGYDDQMIDTGEVFGSWIIEGPDSLAQELPFVQAGLPIQIVDDHAPYKQRKVRILNGAHTSMVLGAFLAHQDIVRECMEEPVIRSFMERTLFEEIIPTLDLPKDQLTTFAASVIDRFNNPYIDHSLLAISLNSTSKWKARVMPSLLEYTKRTGELPPCITFSFAAYIAFYHGAKARGEGYLVGCRGTSDVEPGVRCTNTTCTNYYEVKDDDWVLDFYYEHALDSAEELAHAVIHNQRMWGDALAALPGFEEAVVAALKRIETVEMYNAFKEVLR